MKNESSDTLWFGYRAQLCCLINIHWLIWVTLRSPRPRPPYSRLNYQNIHLLRIILKALRICPVKHQLVYLWLSTHFYAKQCWFFSHIRITANGKRYLLKTSVLFLLCWTWLSIIFAILIKFSVMLLALFAKPSLLCCLKIKLTVNMQSILDPRSRNKIVKWQKDQDYKEAFIAAY